MNFRDANESMMAEMLTAAPIFQPARFWRNLNALHAQRIAKHGIENFRRTLARDYFTWSRVLPWDSQIRFLVKSLPLSTTVRAAFGAFLPPKHNAIGVPESLALNFLTRLVWAYLEQEFPQYTELEDSPFGNPPKIRSGGKLITQDLANSAIEFHSYKDAVRGTVCELGGGYGRNAYVTRKLAFFDRYILCDIPPALAVAQEFIANTFPDDRIFRWRPFTDYEKVKQEIEAAKFVFLLPPQLELLPDQSVDLFLNISSLHEMRDNQVRHFLNEIRRLTRGHFYLKAWTVSNNPDPEVAINAEDYDLSGFEKVFWRTPPIQTRFFETLQFVRTDSVPEAPVGQT